MPDYGITKTGMQIKRLDTIMDEIHKDLTDGFGVNTKLNPESYLNVLVTTFADKIAELWEFGASIYHASYPSSAEGINLDNCMQYSGVVRKLAARSYYPIHCKGIDGTELASGTMIASVTNPVKRFYLNEANTISRTQFNKVSIKALSYADGDYTIGINSNVFLYHAESATGVSDILNGLKAAVTDTDYSVSIDSEHEQLIVECVNEESNNTLVLSDNLTTGWVVSIITFVSEETGDVVMQDNTITNIVTAVTGLESVTNISKYTPGRLRETDAELREAYLKRVYNLSTRMCDSIASSLLQNVSGVKTVAVYENDTNVTDSWGRPPHSVEAVVEGGGDAEIAREILKTKAAGIQTHGSVTVNVPDAYDSTIPVHFNRPTPVYCWFDVSITQSNDESLPPNYADIIENCIVDQIESMSAGSDVTPQKWMSKIYAACTGIAYIDIKIATETESDSTPKTSEYTKRLVSISPREKAVTDVGRIAISLEGT